MVKCAVVFAQGCEEIEGLTQVDVLRRLGVTCDMVGLDSLKVQGSHQIQLTCDKVLSDDLLDYDLVSFPGGLPGAYNLRDSAKLQDLMVKRSKAGKWNAAMCAAPVALAKYGLLDNQTYTCFPGQRAEVEEFAKNATYSEDIVVTDHDHKIITSRGPATTLAFAYELAHSQGLDTSALEEGMQYNYLKRNI